MQNVATMEAVAAVGRAVLELRTLLRLSQVELARRAGTSQALVSRVERGRVGGITIASAATLLEAMGGRLTIGVDRPLIAGRGLQADGAHARCVGHVARRLQAAGWKVAREVAIVDGRALGWIDIVAVHPATGLVLVIEVETELRDLGQLERTLGWYERAAWAAARRLGWRPRATVGILILLATEVNDDRVRANRESLAQAFPVRSAALADLVATGAATDRRRHLAMIDPRSKRRVWLRPTRIDGRRSLSPYADYVDFMRKLG